MQSITRISRARGIRWAAAIGLCLVLAACAGDGGGAGNQAELVEWTAALESKPDTLTITPREPLAGGRTYAVVLTAGITDESGRRLEADNTFPASLSGVPASRGNSPRQPSIATVDDQRGPVALWNDDPEDPGNPYPEARLVREDGGVHVPDRFAERGVPADLEQARAFLRSIADQVETVHGFATTAPVRVALSAPVDLTTVTPETLLFFARSDDSLDLEGALRGVEKLGVARDDVALAVSFPTQPIADDLLAIRAMLVERAAEQPPHLDLVDDDPKDDLEIGVFDTGAPGPFADYLTAHESAGVVAVGLMSAPSFVGPNRIFDPAKVSGEVPAEDEKIDVLLTLPAQEAPPFPVVILQHGFGGSNRSFMDFAAELAAEGMATAAISAVSHGHRGNPTDLLDSTPLQTRDMFRQTNSDQMALVRLIEAGVDLDGDGAPDLDPDRIRYYGASLGGLLGAVLVAIEDSVQTAVLNVAGGRIALLGNAPAIRPLYTGFFAAQAGLPPDSEEFAVVLDRLLELGQQGMEAADGLNYARRWRCDAPAGGPHKRVLLQEGIGDTWVLNEHTEELAAVAGISAQTPAGDASGVCGLWRFDPPDPPRGHSIRQRPEVRAQAVRFLATEGTELADPADLQ